MKKIIVAFAAMAMLVLSGCSIGNTAPDEFGLHYKAGSFSSTQFSNCIEPGQRNVDGPADDHYFYPAGQRTLTFNDTKDANGNMTADFGQITATSAAPEGQQLFVTGMARFHLNIQNEDGTLNCDRLKEFHEQIGIKYNNGNDWAGILRDYLQTPLSNAVQEATKKFNWQDLFFDVNGARAQWQDYIVTKMPEYVKQSTGNDYFVIEGVTLGAPGLPQELSSALNKANENKQLNQAQLEQNARTLSESDGLQPLIDKLGVDGALLYKAIQDGRVQILPVPNGTPLVVGTPR